MLTIKYQTAFKRDYKRLKKRGYDLTLLAKVISMLAERVPLPPEYRDHALTGDFRGCRECHITPDWLLVYEIVEDELLLYLTRTGTHSDLFKKQTEQNIKKRRETRSRRFFRAFRVFWPRAKRPVMKLSKRNSNLQFRNERRTERKQTPCRIKAQTKKEVQTWSERLSPLWSSWLSLPRSRSS